MTNQIVAVLLIVAGVCFSLFHGADSHAGEAEALAQFIKDNFATFDPLAAGLDPIKEDLPLDVFVYNPNLEIGGDIWSFSFSGFSKLQDVEIAIDSLKQPPESDRIYSSFYLNFTIPAVITGHHKLVGVWREDGNEIALGGEGNFTLTGTVVVNSWDHLREEPEGYLEYGGGTSWIDMVDIKLDIPGIIGDDVPAAVAEAITASVGAEIWSVYQSLPLLSPAIQHLEKAFEVTSFEEIVGGGSPVPVKKNVAPPPPTWPPMDAFVAKVMNVFAGSPVEGLEPLRNLDVSINVTWPSNLNLQGTISNLTFHGVKNILHSGSYSPEFSEQITVYSYYPNSYLEGRHNITGTYTLQTGEVLTVGGVERIFTFSGKSTSSSLFFTYAVSETGEIALGYNAGQNGFGIKGGGEWEIDFHGLLDDIPESSEKENSIAWIGDAIDDEIDKLVTAKIKYRVHKVLDSAFQQTTYEEISNGDALVKH